MINRRGLITGLIGFVAAPAIVRASSLMPVKAIDILDLDRYWMDVFDLDRYCAEILIPMVDGYNEKLGMDYGICDYT